MKILVVSYNDSDNLVIENVLKELERRHHELTIFAPFMDHNSIRMFEGLKAEIRPFSTLTNREAKKYDFAFCTSMMMQQIKFLDIYCFVYSLYYDDTFMIDGADFMFTYRSGCLPRCSYRCPEMPVGDPKNDSIPMVMSEEKKRILFIDSGHMPFGTKGKMQIADMVLNICNSFPDYEICIKPRWLREKGIHYTHRNTEHLYDMIEQQCNHEVPENLLMLNEHKDLQELIDSSVSVVTLFTGAILNVILRGKGLVIASGWENEDKFDLRNSVLISDKQKLFEQSGCVVDYKDVVQYLPEGIQAEDSFKKMMFPYISGASVRMADVMEYVFVTYVAHSKYPAAKVYAYETYKEEMEPDPSLTMDALKYERIRDILQQKVAICSYRYSVPINFEKYYQELDNTYKQCPLNEIGYEVFRNAMESLRKETLVEQADMLMNDPIDQAYLLEALFDLRKYDELLSIPEDKILCTGPYHYYLGQLFKGQGSESTAIGHFVKFLKEANSRPFSKYPQEENWGIRRACDFVLQKYDGENVSPADIFDIYSGLYSRDFSIVPFRSRKKIHALLPMIAKELLPEHLQEAIECLELYNTYDRHYRNGKTKRHRNGKKKDTISLDLLRNTVQCFREHGMGYTVAHITIKIKNKIDAIKKRICSCTAIRMLTYFRSTILAGYSKYAEIIKKYGDDHTLLLTGPGTGDAYWCGEIYHAFLKRNADIKPIFCVFAAVGEKIAHLYGIPDVESFSKEEMIGQYKLQAFLDPACIRSVSLSPSSIRNHKRIFSNMIGVKAMDCRSMIHAYFDFSPSDIQLPQRLEACPAEDLQQIVPQRTVILAPYAKSVKKVPFAFWTLLTQELKHRGYHVLTNSSGEAEPCVVGTKPVFVSHDALISLVEYAGVFVGLRSGMFDAIYNANCLQIAIYPDDKVNIGICENSKELYSIRDMYGTDGQRYDIIVNPKNEQDAVCETVSIIQDCSNE